MNNESWNLTEESLDSLVARDGPARHAWLTHVHREIARLCPGAYVVRLRESLEHLVRWQEAEGIGCLEERLTPSIEFDDDRGGPRVYHEGGWNRFRWQDREYRTVSVRVFGGRRDYTYTWAACADRAAAEALVDAVGRHNWNRGARVMVFEDGDWEEAPRLEADLGRYTWDSVVLPPQTGDRIQRAAGLFFLSEQVYRQLEIPWKMGFLLVGPPGTGKTLTTKVLAATCGVPFLYVRGLNSFYESKPDAGSLREMFRGARDRAPCVLCIEDLDTMISEELRSTFLNELDGLEEDYRGVLIVATTNHPERLDAALLHRPSRFDYRFEFPLPDPPLRRSYVMHWVEKLAALGYVTSPEQAMEEIVRRSHGMSHAYLKRIMVGTATRMHSLQERGDAAFTRLALEELADALADRATARKAVADRTDALAGSRVGFTPE